MTIKKLALGLSRAVHARLVSNAEDLIPAEENALGEAPEKSEKIAAAQQKPLYKPAALRSSELKERDALNSIREALYASS